MSESSNKRTVVVGLFILLGLLILGAGILTIGNIHETFTRKIRLTTRFNDVNGLMSGGNIWFSGVKIGTVRKLNFYGQSQVEVIMSIDEDARQYIRKDAKVKISTDGLIGNKIIVISGGTSLASPVADGDTLGVEIALSTDEMMGTFQESNKNLLSITTDLKAVSKKIANGDGSIGKLLNSNEIYNDIKTTTASLQRASDGAQQMTASLAKFTDKLNKKGTLANDLITDTLMYKSLSSTISELQKTADSTSAFVSNLKRASNDPNSPIGTMLKDKETADHLKQTIKNLDSSTKKLDEDLEGLQHSFLLRKYFKNKEKENNK